MIKILYFLVVIVVTNYSYAQKGEAELILKDGTKIEGIGEISGIYTIVLVKFKNDSLRYKAYSKD